MPKRKYTSIPPNYPACIHKDCPLAETCLHQIVYGELLKVYDYLQIVNPIQCTKKEGCTFYRSHNPIIYAKGFIQMQKRMYPDQYNRFMSLCIKHWGRTSYYERRRGDSLLSPSDQTFVISVLKKVGITEELKFDSYEESLNWYD